MTLQPKLSVHNGIPTTTSLDVANYFDRKHKQVINSILGVLPYLSEGFHRRNFLPILGKDSYGRDLEIYQLTKSGFAMIALGFTGEKAIRFREAYITRFDEMEARLKEKELSSVKREYVRERYLPFGEPPVRDAVSIGTAIKHIRILKRLPELTNGKLKGMLKRGEVEGFQNERGHWQIYDDQITKLLGGETR